MPPSASSRSTSTSEVGATKSAKIGEPCVVRTPATEVRSLIGTGRPASPSALRDGQFQQTVGVVPRPIEAEDRQRVHARVDARDPRLERVQKVVRRDHAGP